MTVKVEDPKTTKVANPVAISSPHSATYYADDEGDTSLEQILELLEDEHEDEGYMKDVAETAFGDEDPEPLLELEDLDFEDEEVPPQVLKDPELADVAAPDFPGPMDLQYAEDGEADLEMMLEDEAPASDMTHYNIDELFGDAEEGMLPGAGIVLVRQEEEPERDTTWQDDGDHGKFLDYAVNRLRSIPQHSGQTTVGCEKAISYLRKLDKEISKAIQSDDDNQIDETTAEKIRDKIHEYIDTLEDAYDQLNSKKKRKKKASFSVGKQVVARLADTGDDVQYFVSVADAEDEILVPVQVVEPDDEQTRIFLAGKDQKLTKEASRLVTYVDPFLQSITRLLIRSHITQGKNLQHVYKQLDAQYKFTPREQLSIHELLLQKGLPLNADLGRIMEDHASPFDSNNVEFSTEFYA